MGEGQGDPKRRSQAQLAAEKLLASARQASETAGQAIAASRSALRRAAAAPTDAPAVALAALVIEDDAAARYLTIRLLQAEGIEDIREGSTAEYGLREARRRPFDLALVDFHLPDDDGLSVARLLRQLQPDATILLTSARIEAPPGHVEGVIDGFLPQPLDDGPRFRALIRAAIERCSAGSA